MPNILDASGLQTATQAELLSDKTEALQTIYGADIDLSSSTPDGQWINTEIQSILDQEDLLTQIYNTFNPDACFGVVLDQRVAINGIQRQGGTYTITNITIVNSQSVNLYGLDQSTQPVYTVSDAAGNQWQLVTSSIALAAGTHILVFQAVTVGAVIPIPNTITIPVTYVLGVVSINNPTSYTTLGINEESDAALKIRRQKSVSLSSQGYLAGLLAALDNINGIINAFVYENNGSLPDGDGVPGHSIWVIISGAAAVAIAPAWVSTTSYAYGDIASSAGVNYISWKQANLGNAVTDPAFWGVYNPVAQAIYSKRNAGCGMFGDISYTITQIDGTQFIVSYDSVDQVPLFIKFTASSLDGIHAPNITAIVNGLPSSYMPDVFAEVNINELATLVQDIDPNTLVTLSGFSLSAGGSYTNTLIPASKQDQFQVSSSNIIVLPMILSAPTAMAVIVSGLVTHTEDSVTDGDTIQFTGLGGYGTLTYAMVSGTGSVNASTGLYTSNGVGTDVVRVTDSQAHTTTCILTVVSP